MSKKHTQTFVRDDGETEIEVEYVIDCPGSAPSGMFGPPEDYDPGSAPEIHIEKVWEIGTDMQIAGPDVELTEAERERIEIEIAENPEWWADYGPDPDDWRDRMIDDRLTGGDL